MKQQILVTLPETAHFVSRRKKFDANQFLVSEPSGSLLLRKLSPGSSVDVAAFADGEWSSAVLEEEDNTDEETKDQFIPLRRTDWGTPVTDAIKDRKQP
jgi:hypothetical protein